MLNYFDISNNYIEIGIDEAGRGPLFGPVFTSAVVLPKSNFDCSLIKDSKKFSSKKKINNVANYIKNNCIAWSINYLPNTFIDQYNIRFATYLSMHYSINNIFQKLIDLNLPIDKFHLLIDGNYFPEFIQYHDNSFYHINHTCITKGDNKILSIAAASILAKTERDKYIDNLCINNNLLNNCYDISNNKGYGTKKHIDGIKKYGITLYHRKTFGICKNYCTN